MLNNSNIYKIKFFKFISSLLFFRLELNSI